MQLFYKSIRTKILVFALVVGLPLQMCSPENYDDCNCGPIAGAFFDIKGMELDNFKKTGENSIGIIEENEAVTYNEYAGLGIDYDVEYISQNRPKKPSFSLIQSAYACSCIFNGERGSKYEKLSNITVISLNDFDESHRANDTINDLILAKGFYHQDDEYLQDYLANDTINIQYEGLRLMVDRKPTLNENYKVKVVVELSTGEVYEKVSNSIKIR
ncbi:hypothetical protein [Aequorivita marina]|uniref:hypothetical protein n=1 Tax=Aequorivita marina TaxID=3073654 RepID=UPI002874C161|nr:hypothetical protein [Aequorivita sp. S2608]MDS1298442.1 hypothetical protein [Aequorivita sp. S2608]